MSTKKFVDSNNRFIYQGTPFKEFTGKVLGIPNSKGVIKKIKEKGTPQHPGELVYEYEINFNNKGLRKTPTNIIGREKHSIFFGDSQVIGEGVNDNETIPYYFSDTMTDYIPYNYGFFRNTLPEAFNIIKSVEFQSKFRNKIGEVIYIYRDDYETYSGNIDNVKRQMVLIKKINHLISNISKQLNFTVVILPLSFSSRSLYSQLIDNCINVINLFFIDTGFLTNDQCRYLDGGHTPATNQIISKYISKYINTGYHPVDYFNNGKFTEYEELSDRIGKQSFFMPCLQDVPEDDLWVIIKSISKNYTGIKNDDLFYLELGTEKHRQKMQLINSLRKENTVPDTIAKDFINGNFRLSRKKIFQNKIFKSLDDDYKNIFTELYINNINNEAN